MKLSWKEAGQALRNSLKALRRGEFLLAIGVHEYYLHILYLFILAWASILLSLKIDKTMIRVEQNKAQLHDLEIYHAQKEAQLVRLHSASTTMKALEKMGSEVTLPEKPAVKIDKR